MLKQLSWRLFFVFTLVFPACSYATDARMSYVTPSGGTQALGMVSAICGVDSSGNPLQCSSNTVADNEYTALSGLSARLGYIVPVCSVVDGVPQVCDFNSTPDLSAYLTTTTAQSTYALATNGKLTTPTITQPSIDGGTLTTDGKGNWILSGNNGIKFGNAEWLNYNAADGYIAVNGDLEITGRVNLPTRTTGDNGNYAASTAFVQNTISALQGSVTGDLSASGSSLSLTLGTTNLKLTMAYTSAGTGSLSIVSTSGTVTPVDIYETAAWGTTSFKGYTLDSGSVTTTATVIDSTFYLSSNAWGTYHIGAGGSLYIVDIFGSGAGKRTVMSWRKVL